ncbi:MAG TPA: hypothetical protein VGM77_07455 [Gemmatimonadales bacterium]|jgi:hypothetical protein
MTLFDLLFLVCAMALLVTCLRGLYLAARRRWMSLGSLVIKLATAIAVYLAVLLGVSIVSPARLLPLGEPQCADEWCIAVTGSARTATIDGTAARGTFDIVTVRVSNRGLGRRQREVDVYAYLMDAAGHTYQVSPAGEAALQHTGISGDSLTDFVDAGRSIERHLVFDVPVDVTDLRLIKATHHWTPAQLVIGDGQSIAHRPVGMQTHQVGSANGKNTTAP